MGMDGGCLLIDISKLENFQLFQEIKNKIKLNAEEVYIGSDSSESKRIRSEYKKYIDLIVKSKDLKQFRDNLIILANNLEYFYFSVFDNPNYFLISSGDNIPKEVSYISEVMRYSFGDCISYYETWT